MLDNPYELETLPASDLDLIIPTQVAELDLILATAKEQLAMMESRIREIESDRNILLSRAKELHITDDGKYKIIEVPVYPKKKVDVGLLKKNYEEKYDLIIANRESTYKDKLEIEREKILTDITQADLKAVVKDKAVLAMLIPEQKIPVRCDITVVKR